MERYKGSCNLSYYEGSPEWAALATKWLFQNIPKKETKQITKKQASKIKARVQIMLGIKMAFENTNEVYVLCTNKLSNRAIDLNNNSPK